MRHHHDPAPCCCPGCEELSEAIDRAAAARHAVEEAAVRADKAHNLGTRRAWRESRRWELAHPEEERAP